MRDLMDYVEEVMATIQAIDNAVDYRNEDYVLRACKEIDRLLTELEFKDMFISDEFKCTTINLQVACDDMVNHIAAHKEAEANERRRRP